MQNKTLQMKRALHTAALLIMLLNVAGMGKGYAQPLEYEYDFSANCSSGQTLYYKITGSSTVAVTYPCFYEYAGGSVTYWCNHDKPTGALYIPETVTNNGINYSVTQIRARAFRACSDLSMVAVPNTVQGIGIEAFMGCTSLKSITISSSVNSIGYDAFYNCSKLTKVNITDIASWCNIAFGTNAVGIDGLKDYWSNPLYYAHNLYINGSMVRELVIPEGVQRISAAAFISANNIRTVTIPNSVVVIDRQAFQSCINLASVNIPNSVTQIGPGAFAYCSSLPTITIPESVTKMGVSAFYRCSALTTVDYSAINCELYGGSGTEVFQNCSTLSTLNIGNNVRSLSSWLFNYPSISAICISDITSWCGISFDSGPFSSGINPYYNGSLLNDLVIPEGVSTISSYAFQGAICLRSISLPNSLTEIGAFSFAECSGITGSLILPNSLVMIGVDAFKNCSGFTNVYFTGNISQWCNITFKSSYSNPLCYTHNLYFGNDLVTELNIPETVTEIKDYSFYNCSNISTLTIPRSVESIGEKTFYNCNGLSSVNYNAINCFAIQENTFTNCPIITVYIGDMVQAIPSNAFINCSTLNTIMAYGTTPPALGANAFANISPVAALFVPCGSQMEYFSNWSIFEYNNIHEDCTPRLVSIDSNITGGTVTSSVSQASMGQEVMLIITPNTGMHLSSLNVYNSNNPSQSVPVSLVNNATYTTYRFNMPTFAVTATATFEHDAAYTISISQSIVGGHVTASASSATAGETITLDVHPNSGYELQSLTVCNANDGSQTVSVTNNTFIMPSFDVMVSASFNYTSVDENDCVSASIHPNPTSSIIKIEAEELKHITISNLLGQTIFEGKASGDEFIYDLGKHGTGLYLIRIETASGVAVKKVSVAR